MPKIIDLQKQFSKMINGIEKVDKLQETRQTKETGGGVIFHCRALMFFAYSLRRRN